MGKIKRYTGGKWVDYNDVRIRKNGNFNTKATVRRYTGSKWEVISEEKHVRTWEASWTRSYDQGNNPKPMVADVGRLYQGRYGNPDSQVYGQPWGRQRSLIGFPTSLQSELNGARIEKFELYLHIEWAWYWAGAVANIGLHNFTSTPSRFNHIRYGINAIRYNSRDEGKWITIDKNIAAMFASGAARGFTLIKESDDPLFYAYWYGTNGGDKKPKIRVTYYK